MNNDLTNLDLFSSDDRGSMRMFEILKDPDVQQITANRHDRIFYTDSSGPKKIERVFGGPDQYVSWLNQLMLLTDVGYTDILTAAPTFVEGSFRPDRCDIHGSIHIATHKVSRGEPVLTIRKQPLTIVTLDKMFEQGMMSVDMRLFLEQCVRGRLNILVSGGSGTGKTTLARALSWFVDPSHRMITVEEIDELHLGDRLPNVVAMTTHKEVDEHGKVLAETSLEDLVREALRMRADRTETCRHEQNQNHAGPVQRHCSPPWSRLLSAPATDHTPTPPIAQRIESTGLRNRRPQVRVLLGGPIFPNAISGRA